MNLICRAENLDTFNYIEAIVPKTKDEGPLNPKQSEINIARDNIKNVIEKNKELRHKMKAILALRIEQDEYEAKKIQEIRQYLMHIT